MDKIRALIILCVSIVLFFVYLRAIMLTMSVRSVGGGDLLIAAKAVEVWIRRAWQRRNL
jgi:hypothetical protein